MLRLGEALPIVCVDVSEVWRGALELGLQAGHSVYDTLFVELASRLATRVATYDPRLRSRFPDQTRLPRELLAERA